MPETSSKNSAAGVVSGDVTGVAVTMLPAQGSKNADTQSQAASATETAVTTVAASGSFVTCGAFGNMNWTTTQSSFAVIRQCSLSVPQNGWVFITANGSLARQNGEYEALFEIGIDSTTGDADIDRWVNVYDDSGDGTDKSVALSVLKPVTAGTHTFSFLGKRYSGTGTVLVYDPTLIVIVPGARIYLPLVVR